MEDWVMQGKPALVLIHMQHAITDPEGRVAFLHAKATWDSGHHPQAAGTAQGLPRKRSAGDLRQLDAPG